MARHHPQKYTGVGKSRFTLVHIEKDMQVAIISVALITVFRILTSVNLLLATAIVSFDIFLFGTHIRAALLIGVSGSRQQSCLLHN